MERKNFKWYIKGGSDSVGGREGTSIPDRWDMNNFSISLFSLQELLCWNSQSLTIWWGFKIWTEFSGYNQLLLQGLHHSNASVGSLWQAIVVRAGRSTLEEKPLNGVSCLALHSTGNAGGIRAVVIGEFADPLWPSTRASIHRAGRSTDTLALLIPWDRQALGALGEGHPGGTALLLPKPYGFCCPPAGHSLGQSLPRTSIHLFRGLGYSKNILLVPVQEQDSDHGEPLLLSPPYATQTGSEKTWM